MGTVKEANQDYERFVARDYRGPCPAYHLSAALQRVDVAFHQCDGVGSHDKYISGSITQPAHSLSTLRNMGYPNATQDSLPAGGQP